MPADKEQSRSNTPGVYTEAVARVKNELFAEQTRKSKRDNKVILFILLIMILIITQMIILLAGSGTNTSPVPADDAVVTLEDIKVTNDELKEVMNSIDVINTEPVAVVQEEEITDVKVVVNSKPAVKPEKVVTKTVRQEPARKKPAALVPIANTSDDVISVVKVADTAAEKKPDYIKHDNKGNSLADDIGQWTCVHDTTTGLMWEVKSQDEAIRYSNNLYSWYDPERETLSGKSDGGRCKGGIDCDTNAYVQAMNEKNYCGHNDWRLPTKEQMQTLIYLKNGKGDAKINKQYFPQTVPSWYWTSSDEDIKADYAWYVLFRNGFALSDLKERPKHIRLVRKQLNQSKGAENVY